MCLSTQPDKLLSQSEFIFIFSIVLNVWPFIPPPKFSLFLYLIGKWMFFLPLFFTRRMNQPNDSVFPFTRKVSQLVLRGARGLQKTAASTPLQLLGRTDLGSSR